MAYSATHLHLKIELTEHALLHIETGSQCRTITSGKWNTVLYSYISKAAYSATQ